MSKDKNNEQHVVYDDPELGRMQYPSRGDFTSAVEHRKMCCNYRYCHHTHFWRFDDSEDECHVVMEACQCRRRAPAGNGFPTVRADDWCGEFDRRDDCF